MYSYTIYSSCEHDKLIVCKRIDTRGSSSREGDGQNFFPTEKKTQLVRSAFGILCRSSPAPNFAVSPTSKSNCFSFSFVYFLFSSWFALSFSLSLSYPIQSILRRATAARTYFPSKFIQLCRFRHVRFLFYWFFI